MNALDKIRESKHRSSLFLSGYNLSKLSPEIARLQSLNTLVLRNNKLVGLPPEIVLLAYLYTLDLAYNRFAKLPYEVVQLTSLKELNLSNNQIAKLPSDFNKLTNLESLNLGNNLLTDFPAEIIQLTNLETLNLECNKITQIPSEIAQLTKLQKINCNNNPLKTPPKEVAYQGIAAIRDYFESLKDGDEDLNEVKIHIIGNGRVGKTSLLKRILYKTFDEDESITKGINIEEEVICIDKKDIDIKDKNIKAHFWDFGGQDFMQPSHQCFYTDRSLYVYVLDEEHTENIEDWLTSIEKLGGNSPVIIVINKIDKFPYCEIDNRSLKNRFRNIIDICRISCKTEEYMNFFENSMKKGILEVKTTSMKLPKRWIDVKTKIEKKKELFLKYEDFIKLCDDSKVKREHVDTLATTLHSLGIMLYYKNRIEARDICLLEPRWLTKALYRILHSEEIKNNNGILNIEMLDNIFRINELKDIYPRNKDNYIIGLMEEFELCYKLDNGNKIVIPQLFGEEKPYYKFSSNIFRDSEIFVIKYDFLPKSILPRLIVRMHNDIKDNYYWKSGVVLESKKFKSIAVIEISKNGLRVEISGKNKNSYFAVILHQLDTINEDFVNLNIELIVYLQDNEGQRLQVEINNNIDLPLIINALKVNRLNDTISNIVINLHEGDVNMSEYNIKNSQVGTVGDNSSTENSTFVQNNFSGTQKITKDYLVKLNAFLDSIENLKEEELTRRDKIKAASHLVSIIEAIETEDTEKQHESVTGWKEWYHKAAIKTREALAFAADIVTLGIPLINLLLK